MRVAADTPLAEHVYALDVVKDGRTIEYALIVEIHHPDYLTRRRSRKIYGPVDASDHEASRGADRRSACRRAAAVTSA